MALLPQQPFVWGPQGQQLTPDQVERLRAQAALAAQRASDTGPVGSFAGGLARLVDGWGAYRGNQRADAQEAAGMQSANDVISALMGGNMTGMQAPVSAPQGGSSPVADALVGPDPSIAGKFANDRAAALRAGLIQRGLPEHVADAFVLNAQDESGLNPGIVEAEPNVHGTRGFGLMQWTGPRRAGLEQFAQASGRRVDDMDTQLDYLMTELQGPERGAAQAILSAPDTGQAAAAIVNKFLRPAEEHRARREAAYLGGAAPIPAGGASVVGQGGISPVTAALSQAMGNPWVQKQAGPVLQALMQQDMQRQNALYQQQLQQQDPMYQAQLQQAQLQNQAMMSPPPPKPIEVGGVLLDPTTYQPIFDSRQGQGAEAFTLSPGQQRFDAQGNPIASVPGEAPAMFQTLAPEEVAQLGLPPGAYQRAADGKISQIGGNGVTVNNNMGDDKFGEAFAKGDAATLGTISEAGMQAQRNLGRVDRLESLLAQGPSGMEAGIKSLAGEYGIKTEGIDTLQAAQALINTMVPEQRQPGSGPMSDADLALFKQSLPRLINSAEGNALIIHTLRGIAQYDAQGAEIVQRLRAGEIDRATAFNLLQQRQNPLAGFNDQTSRFSEPAAAQGLSGSGWSEVNGVKIRRKAD